jgi:phage gp36-like protein
MDCPVIIYASLADLYALYGEEEINQRADRDRTGTPAPELIRRVLVDATAEINAALRARYRLPIAPDPLIRRICCDLAREALYVDKTPEPVAERAVWARAQLAKIADGKLSLCGAEIGAPMATVEMVSGREHSPFMSPFARRRSVS